MERGEVLRTLQGLPLVQYIPEAQRGAVAALFADVSKEVALAPGEILIRQGELGGETGYVLVDGSVEVEPDAGAPIRLMAPALLGEMNQFNPQAQRTATVRALTPIHALRFAWPAFYAKARSSFSVAGQGLIVDAMERCVLERFHRSMLLDLALFEGLDDALKLRVCLLLQWVTQPVAFSSGQVLFEQGGMCGGEGWLLTHGEVELRMAGQTHDVRHAPDLLGVLPQFDPGLRWTATAAARGPVEALKFSWLEFNALFMQRAAAEAQAHFWVAVKNNAHRHFVH
ncbi:MAG: cyclic nucleotide-binding domain-containing protein [Candidatus Hydrogenedentes bacterium]|nr:cyclic nucleotide-binding domain-containing protein [Candidatus Hydrogenedentota bacterium]